MTLKSKKMSSTIHRSLSKKRKRGYAQKRKFKPEVCQSNMTFEECELAVLRQAVDNNQKIKGEKMVNKAEIQKMINIVENFLEKKKLLCYGGTAINNILPKEAQFYDYNTDVPDYDFFSDDALNHAKELADIYDKNGYSNVEAKSGMHHGTYKVFVNFIPMADITSIHPQLFKALYKKSLKVAGIHYVPPDFLRMSMYLELSRPEGDVSRWEKVLKRLTLLNQFHPVEMPEEGCKDVLFQRPLDNHPEKAQHIFDAVRTVFIEMGAVFFGGYANALYSRYMPQKHRDVLQPYPDFDVLHEDPERCAKIITERLEYLDIEAEQNIKIINHTAIGELIPESVEIQVNKDTVAFIYKPIACHNYNVLKLDGRELRVATIDTILSFYLAFLFIDQPIFSAFKNRHLCLSNFLFELEEKNRLAQKGLLRRFTPTCYGTQETLESIRAQKAAKFAELKTNRNSTEYQEWFLYYNPSAPSTNKTKKTTSVASTTVKKKKMNKLWPEFW